MGVKLSTHGMRSVNSILVGKQGQRPHVRPIHIHRWEDNIDVYLLRNMV